MKQERSQWAAITEGIVSRCRGAPPAVSPSERRGGFELGLLYAKTNREILTNRRRWRPPAVVHVETKPRADVIGGSVGGGLQLSLAQYACAH